MAVNEERTRAEGTLALVDELAARIDELGRANNRLLPYALRNEMFPDFTVARKALTVLRRRLALMAFYFGRHDAELFDPEKHGEEYF